MTRSLARSRSRLWAVHGHVTDLWRAVLAGGVCDCFDQLKEQSVCVSVGDTIDYGEIIGLCGTSGRSGNVPHLHFEVFDKIKYDYADAIPISFNNLRLLFCITNIKNKINLLSSMLNRRGKLTVKKP